MSDRPLPPACQLTEQAIIGAIFESQDAFKTCKDAGAKAEWFTDPELRNIWIRCEDEVSNGRLLDDITFQSRLGNFGLLNECRDKCTHILNLPEWLSYLKTLYQKRVVISHFDSLEKAISDPSLSPEEVSERLTELTEIAAHAFGKNGLPPLRDMARAFKEEIKEPEQIIEKIAHRGAKIALGGNSKGFKTWTLMCMSVCIATGKDWLKFKTHRTKVLYLNFELSPWEFDKRLRRVCEGFGIKELDASWFVAWNLRGHSASYKTLMPHIIEIAVREGFGFIVIDPTYKFYGDDVDENKAGDIARVLNSFEQLAQKTGAAIAFGTHFSKGNQAAKDPMDRISGSGVFGRDPDTILTFTKHKKPDHFSVDFTLRSFEPIPSLVTRWECPLMVIAEGEDPNELRTEKKSHAGRKPKGNALKLLELLSEPLSSGEWEKVASERLGLSRSLFYSLKDDLVEDSHIVHDPITKKWERCFSVE